MVSFPFSELSNKAYFLVPVHTNYTRIQRRTRSSPHLHSVYHIVMVFEGNGILENDEGLHGLQRGDIIIINPNEEHIFSTTDETLYYFAFNFYLIPYRNDSQWGMFMRSRGRNTKLLERHAEIKNLQNLWNHAVDRIYFQYQKSLWSEFERMVKKHFGVFREYLHLDAESKAKQFGNYVSHASMFFVEFLMTLELRNAKSFESDPFVQEVVDYLDANIRNRYSLQELSQALRYAPPYLCTRFRISTGATINTYFYQLKIQKACEYLKQTDKNVTEIAYDLGFSSSQHFSNRFRQEKKMTPKEYKRNLEVY